MAVLEQREPRIVEVRTRQKFARVSVGTYGITSKRVVLDSGVGAVKFEKSLSKPGLWLEATDGTRIKASAIVAFSIEIED
jgi:hypothetical protein